MTDRVPILRIGDALLVSIQVDLQDQTAVALQEDLAQRIVDTGARGVIIDISALEIVDSFIGRMLSSIAGISKVLDAETVVVGMRPAVAITLVELGLYLEAVRTALTVERAFAIIAERSAAAGLVAALDDDGADVRGTDVRGTDVRGTDVRGPDVSS
jgi:rsbT antagonist protein RsbS